MKKVLFGIIFCFLSSAALANEQSLQVNISVDQGSFSKELKRGKGFFAVKTKVTNVSAVPQKIVVMPCSYGYFSWIVDRPEFLMGVESCKMNVPRPVTLAPNDVFQKPVIVGINKKAAPGPISFRLGFHPVFDSSVFSAADVVWSEPVTVTVEPWMLKLLSDYSKIETHIEIKK